MDLSMFEKVNIEARATSRRAVRKVSIDPSVNRFSLSSTIVAESGLKKGDRLDLYKCGKTYMLKRSDVGLLTLRQPKSSKGLTFSNFSAYAEIKHYTSLRIFKAWVEEGIVFFKIDEEAV